MFGAEPTLVTETEALPGRDQSPFVLAEQHAVLDAPLVTDHLPAGSL